MQAAFLFLFSDWVYSWTFWFIWEEDGATHLESMGNASSSVLNKIHRL